MGSSKTDAGPLTSSSPSSIPGATWAQPPTVGRTLCTSLWQWPHQYTAAGLNFDFSNSWILDGLRTWCMDFLCDRCATSSLSYLRCFSLEKGPGLNADHSDGLSASSRATRSFHLLSRQLLQNNDKLGTWFMLKHFIVFGDLVWTGSMLGDDGCSLKIRTTVVM